VKRRSIQEASQLQTRRRKGIAVGLAAAAAILILATAATSGGGQPQPPRVLLGKALVDDLGLQRIDYGQDKSGCQMASEAYDSPGLYCLDSALPEPGSDGYLESFYKLWRGLAGESASDEEATTWADQQRSIRDGGQ
jgi:hypothetical protein